MCVRLMLPGEIALVTCPPDYAYDKFPRLYSVSIIYIVVTENHVCSHCYSYLHPHPILSQRCMLLILVLLFRPANVPEGAHIQWEIELLRFEMLKVMK